MNNMRMVFLSLILLPGILMGQNGSLLVVGGGSESNDNPESWSTQAYSWAVSQAPNKKVAVIHYSNTGDWLKPYFTDHCGAEDAENFVINSSNANDQELMNDLKEYDMFFFRGGDQYYYYTYYNGTLMEQIMKEKFEAGGVLAGTSAGLAIMSEVIFWAENGSAYSDACIKNINDSNITLADDFMEAAPGLIFDSHFVNRGRMGRLIAFMANYEKNHARRIIGAGVDETTALGITSNNEGIAFGTRAVSFYELPEEENFGPGPVLSARNIQVTQIVHGDTIDLETMEVTGLSLRSEPNINEEIFPNPIYMSGSENLSSTNISLLEKLVADGNGAADNILIITGSSISLATQFKNKLEELGATNVSIGQALYSFEDDANLENNIQQASKLVFVENTTYNFNVFLASGSNGQLLKSKTTEAGVICAFIGDNSRFAGPWIVNNYLSGTSNISLAEGLNLLKTTCIIPKTFDPPGGSTDNWYSTHISIPFALITEKLAYGLWLNHDNYAVYKPENNQTFITSYGNSPAMLLQMNAGHSDFTEMTYNGQANEIPLSIAGFDNMELSIIAEGESIKLGNRVANTSESYTFPELKVFPNPVKSTLKLESSALIYSYVIRDSTGKIIQKSSLIGSASELAVDRLSPGIYFLEINQENTRTTTKFMKIN